MLPAIHMFWHGAPLSRIERLSIESFLANGHAVNLHLYDSLQGVPVGASIVDASVVLPRDVIFRHRRTGSLGPFADWFRYRVLVERGGIWADTDVVCLEPLAYDDAVVFGWEDSQYVNTAVLGLPMGHPLADWMARACDSPNTVHPYDTWSRRMQKWARRYLQFDRRDNVHWGEYGPKGFTKAARHFGLLGKALPRHEFYAVPCAEWRRFFCSVNSEQELEAVLPERSRAVHLWHAMMHGEPGFNKNGGFPADSPFEQLCARYGVKIGG